jgi:type 2 lantibiotic biosynthesis protein LanM
MRGTNGIARDLVRQWQEAIAAAGVPLLNPKTTAWALLDTAETYTWVADARRRAPDGPARSVWARETPLGQPRDLSDRNGDSEVWLRHISARARSLYDRLDTSSCGTETEADAAFAQEWLQVWARCVAPGGAEDNFEKYLLWHDLDLRTVRSALAAASFCEDDLLSAWCKTLGEAVFGGPLTARADVCDPAQPLPFETLLLPFVQLSLLRIQEAAATAYSWLAPAAQRALAFSLLETLVLAAKDAFYLEFACFRARDFASLAPLVFQEPDALFRQFIAHMQTGGLLAFYEKYPALARLLAVLTDLSTAATIEFLQRLETDIPQINHLWGIASGQVVSLRDKISDPHRGGRRALDLVFASGLHLVYKPRDMGMEAAYNDLLAWLNDHGSPVTLRPLRVLDLGTHGWVEFATYDACADQAAVTRYYQRAGALTCLVYCLRGSDCHMENIVAAGEYPILVDCETLIEPWPRALDAGVDRNRRQVMVSRLMRDSVLMGGLLPNPTDSIAMEGLGDIWGLGSGDSPAAVPRQHWIHINTDRMMIVSRAGRPASWHNIPHVGGARVYVGAYLEPLIAGFQAMYRFLVAQQQTLLSDDGPLAAFRGRFVRFMFRATRIYTRLYEDASGAAALRDGLCQSLPVDQLAQAFLCAGEARPASWALLAFERRALLRGDVPYFGGRTDDTSLLLEDGTSIAGYFAEPSYQAVLKKLSQLNEADLAFQIELIRSALSQKWAVAAGA